MKEVMVYSMVQASLLAIHKDLLMVVVSWWVDLYLFSLESNASNVFSLFVDHYIIHACNLIFKRNIQWILSYIWRAGNDDMDVIARIGSSIFSFFKFAWNYRGLVFLLSYARVGPFQTYTLLYFLILLWSYDNSHLLL